VEGVAPAGVEEPEETTIEPEAQDPPADLEVPGGLTAAGADAGAIQEIPSIPAGTQIGLELERSISTETHMAGDLFFSRVVEDVLDEDGMVLLPKGTRVRGRVVESRESRNPDRDPVLQLAVERLLLAGTEVDIRAEILRAEVRADAGDSDRESAAKVATGAAAGALLGRILGGGGKAAVKGAIAGAIAGGAVAYVTRDGQARIEEGTLILIRLLESVPLPDDS
jgi:hypothetical protein